MDGDVSEINVKELRVYLRENLDELAHFGIRHCPRRIPHLLEPESPGEMCGWLSDDRDFLKWVAVRFLAFLRDDKRLDALQRSDLPVDVEHLRLEERRAITGDDGTSDVSLLRHCRYLSMAVRRGRDSIHRLSSKLKYEKLNPRYFRRIVLIVHDRILRCTVLGGRLRIEHLEKITAANSARNGSANWRGSESRLAISGRLLSLAHDGRAIGFGKDGAGGNRDEAKNEQAGFHRLRQGDGAPVESGRVGKSK